MVTQQTLTHNCDCEEDQKPWLITIKYDDFYHGESPLDEDEGCYVEFVERERWTNSTSLYVCCHYETDDYVCDQLPSDHPAPYTGRNAWDLSKHGTAFMEWHQHVPSEDLVATLQPSGPYWYLDQVLLPGDSADSDRSPAAVLLWKNGPKDFVEWLSWADDGRAHSAIIAKEKLTEYLKAIVEEYSMWANGEVYYFEIHEGTDPMTCDQCGCIEYTYKEWDACGGFIGYEYVKEAAVEYLPEGADYEIKEPY